MRDIPNFEGKCAITEKGEVWSYKHKKFLKPNAHINDCCNGKRNIAGGYHWEFVDRGECYG